MNDSAGALALVGSGEYLAQSQELEHSLVRSAQQIRGERAKYYVQIPTASGHESANRRVYWRNLGESAASRIGIEQKYLDVQNREDALALDAESLNAVAEAALIYFSGGDPYLLTEAMAETRLWSAVLDAYSKGASLAGCSAGAMAFCSHVVEFRTLGRNSRAGLGLLENLQVIPHFDRMHMAARIPARSGKAWWAVPTLGIDEMTAAIWERGAWRVWGRGGVYHFGDPQEERVVARAGEALTLPDPVGSQRR